MLPREVMMGQMLAEKLLTPKNKKIIAMET
jgi:hypothetical protein